MLPGFLTDVRISHAPLPHQLAGVTARGVLWQASPQQLLMDVPDVARYLVEEGGHSVTIDMAPHVPEQQVAYFFRMLPLAALLYQRGLLAFHGAAVTDGEKTLLLAGNSGSGKSTLLATLLRQGWQMLADELAIVSFDEQGRAMVHPTYPGIALWPESFDKLGMACELFPYCDANRREFNARESFAAGPRPLHAIYRLNVHNKADIESKPVKGIEYFHAIGGIQYNSQVADVLCDRMDYLRCVEKLTRHVPYCSLMRPRGTWSADLLADHVLNGFRESR